MRHKHSMGRHRQCWHVFHSPNGTKDSGAAYVTVPAPVDGALRTLNSLRWPVPQPQAEPEQAAQSGSGDGAAVGDDAKLLAAAAALPSELDAAEQSPQPVVADVAWYQPLPPSTPSADPRAGRLAKDPEYKAFLEHLASPLAPVAPAAFEAPAPRAVSGMVQALHKKGALKVARLQRKRAAKKQSRRAAADKKKDAKAAGKGKGKGRGRGKKKGDAKAKPGAAAPAMPTNIQARPPAEQVPSAPVQSTAGAGGAGGSTGGRGRGRRSGGQGGGRGRGRGRGRGGS